MQESDAVPMLEFEVAGRIRLPMKAGDDVNEAVKALPDMLARSCRAKGGDAQVYVTKVRIAPAKVRP